MGWFRHKKLFPGSGAMSDSLTTQYSYQYVVVAARLSFGNRMATAILEHRPILLGSVVARVECVEDLSFIKFSADGDNQVLPIRLGTRNYHLDTAFCDYEAGVAVILFVSPLPDKVKISVEYEYHIVSDAGAAQNTYSASVQIAALGVVTNEEFLVAKELCKRGLVKGRANAKV